jgi:vacuolar-type H+-ATPase subunit H
VSLEIVRKIKEAESKAEEIKKDAMAQAKQIALENQKTCSILIEQAEAEIREIKKKALSEADIAAEKEGGTRKSQIDTQCKAIEESASARIDQAVNIVIERIMVV